jgi:hypothetical protein
MVASLLPAGSIIICFWLRLIHGPYEDTFKDTVGVLNETLKLTGSVAMALGMSAEASSAQTHVLSAGMLANEEVGDSGEESDVNELGARSLVSLLLLSLIYCGEVCSQRGFGLKGNVWFSPSISFKFATTALDLYFRDTTRHPRIPSIAVLSCCLQSSALHPRGPQSPAERDSACTNGRSSNPLFEALCAHSVVLSLNSSMLVSWIPPSRQSKGARKGELAAELTTALHQAGCRSQ